MTNVTELPTNTTLETAIATLKTSPLIAESLPAAEAGNTTSEYALVKIFGIVSGTGFTLLTLASGAHLLTLTPEALTFLGSAVTLINGMVISIYTVFRSIRKKGTPG
jgi:hypothetical protein